MYAGTDERSYPIVLQYQSNHYRVKVLCFVEPYLEVEDAEIESTVVNLNPRIDTVVNHHHYPELELAI